jgi:hypothetical protein
MIADEVAASNGDIKKGTDFRDQTKARTAEH